MQLRFFFRMFHATQLLGGAAYQQEIKKLRDIGYQKILPNLKNQELRDYPYDVCFIFMVYEDADLITLSVMAGYILHLLELTITIQSADSRVIKSVSIKTKKALKEKDEGCILIIEKHLNSKVEKIDYHSWENISTDVSKMGCYLNPQPIGHTFQ